MTVDAAIERKVNQQKALQHPSARFPVAGDSEVKRLTEWKIY